MLNKSTKNTIFVCQLCKMKASYHNFCARVGCHRLQLNFHCNDLTCNIWFESAKMYILFLVYKCFLSVSKSFINAGLYVL